MTYEAFSLNPNRLPSYTNHRTYKSFLMEAFWRYPEKPWGMDLRIVEAGRTNAQETIGTYQTSPLSISVTSWQFLGEREFWRKDGSFFSGLVGVGSVTNQWERSRTVFVNGVNVDSEMSLSSEGTSRSGIRVSIDNASFPIGMRLKSALGKRLYLETLLSYSFLIDLTDILQGSSPFSGWETQAKFTFGWEVFKDIEVFLGFFGYTNHMAAPTGNGGLRLKGGNLAPEGIYMLWQENEVHLASGISGFRFHF